MISGFTELNAIIIISCIFFGSEIWEGLGCAVLVLEISHVMMVATVTDGGMRVQAEWVCVVTGLSL